MLHLADYVPLPAIIRTVIEAVRAGELDEAIAAVTEQTVLHMKKKEV